MKIEEIKGLTEHPEQSFVVRGHIVSRVNRATYLGRPSVVKIGQTDVERREIAGNVAGYKAIKRLGGENFIPNFALIEAEDGLVLIMDDGGETVIEWLRRHPEPMSAYREILTALARWFSATRHPVEGSVTLQPERDLVLSTVDAHLRDLVVRADLWGAFRRSALRVEITHVCYASFDLTPNNILRGGEKFMLIDPKEAVAGIPLMGLACFAGVCQVNALPSADEAAALISHFALDEVAPLLGLSPPYARKAYLTGRIVQKIMSARFRRDAHPDAARNLFADAEVLVQSVLDCDE